MASAHEVGRRDRATWLDIEGAEWRRRQWLSISAGSGPSDFVTPATHPPRRRPCLLIEFGVLALLEAPLAVVDDLVQDSLALNPVGEAGAGSGSEPLTGAGPLRSARGGRWDAPGARAAPATPSDQRQTTPASLRGGMRKADRRRVRLHEGGEQTATRGEPLHERRAHTAAVPARLPLVISGLPVAPSQCRGRPTDAPTRRSLRCVYRHGVLHPFAHAALLPRCDQPSASSPGTITAKISPAAARLAACTCSAGTTPPPAAGRSRVAVALATIVA
jgi:hypothetical protein